MDSLFIELAQLGKRAIIAGPVPNPVGQLAIGIDAAIGNKFDKVLTVSKISLEISSAESDSDLLTDADERGVISKKL